MARQDARPSSSVLGPIAFKSALRELKYAQKPGHGVPAYTRWINRGLARGVAALLASWGWSANKVSLASALVSFVGILLLLLLPVEPWTGVIAAVILAVGYLLDSADGQVARLTGTGSSAGEWLDHVTDAARTPAIHLCILVGFIKIYGASAWQWWIPLIYCLIAATHFMGQILAEQLLRLLAEAGPAQADEQPAVADQPSSPGLRRSVARSIIMVHTDSGTLCWLFLTWGFPPLFLLLYVLMFAANSLTSVVSLTRRFRDLRAGEGIQP